MAGIKLHKRSTGTKILNSEKNIQTDNKTNLVCIYISSKHNYIY